MAWLQANAIKILQAAGVAPGRMADEARQVAALLRKIVDREDRADIVAGWIKHAREVHDGTVTNPMAAWTSRVKHEINELGDPNA